MIAKEYKKQNILYTVLMYIVNIIFLSPIMIYGGQNFSVDSYGIALDYRGHIEAFIGSYRWFGAFVYEIYYKIFNHNPITNSTVDCVVFIVLVAGIVSLISYTLYKLINKKSILSHILINLSVLISVLNVWYPPVAVPLENAGGNLTEFNFASIFEGTKEDGGNVIMTALYPENDYLLARFCNYSDTDAEISFRPSCGKVTEETDLLGNGISAISSDNDEKTALKFRAWEIKTVKIKL